MHHWEFGFMDTTLLIIILAVVLLVGVGGFGARRWR
jgi:hypothetical protein